MFKNHSLFASVSGLVQLTTEIFGGSLGRSFALSTILLIGTAYDAQAAGAATATKVTVANQGALPNSARTAVIGINLYDDTVGGVAMPNFTVSINTLSEDPEFLATHIERISICGDYGGYYRDGAPLVSQVPALGETSWIFNLGGNMPANDTGGNAGNDYFVVIETANTLPHAAYFKVRCTISYAGAVAATSDKITCEAEIVDVTPMPGTETYPDPGAVIYHTSSIASIFLKSCDGGIGSQPEVNPMSVPYRILGLNIAGSSGQTVSTGYIVDKLTKCVVTFDGIDAGSAMFSSHKLDPWPNVAIWKDDGDGIFNPTYEGGADTFVGPKAGDDALPGQVVHTGGNMDDLEITIEPTADGKVDFFITQTTDPNHNFVTGTPKYGDQYTATINWDTGIQFEYCDQTTDATGIAKTTKTLHSIMNIHNQSADSPEADGMPGPLYSFNMCDSYGAGSNETLQWIKIYFKGGQGYNGFQPTDLAPLTDNKYSGISFWNDDKTVVGPGNYKDYLGQFDLRGGIDFVGVGKGPGFFDTNIPLSPESLVWYNSDNSIWTSENDDPGHKGTASDPKIYYVKLRPKAAWELPSNDRNWDLTGECEPVSKNTAPVAGTDALHRGNDFHIAIRGNGVGTMPYGEELWERGIDYGDKVEAYIQDPTCMMFGIKGQNASDDLFPATSSTPKATVPTFYNDLTRTAGNVKLSPAEKTAVVGINMVAPPKKIINFRDTGADGSFTTGTDAAWIDVNADGAYNQGETIIVNNGVTLGGDDNIMLPPDVLYQDKTGGTANSFDIGTDDAWIDADHNGKYTAGELVITGAPAVGDSGVTFTRVVYRDNDDSGTYTVGDDVWIDARPLNGKYDKGETIILDPGDEDNKLVGNELASGLLLQLVYTENGSNTTFNLLTDGLWIDTNSNFTYDDGVDIALLLDGDLANGDTGVPMDTVYYRDVNGDDTFTTGTDDAWLDANVNGWLDLGETTLVHNAADPIGNDTSKSIGRIRNAAYKDVDKSDDFTTGTDRSWVDANDNLVYDEGETVIDQPTDLVVGQSGEEFAMKITLKKFGVMIFDTGVQNFAISDIINPYLIHPQENHPDAGCGLALYKDNPTAGINGTFDDQDIRVSMTRVPYPGTGGDVKQDHLLYFMDFDETQTLIPYTDTGVNAGDDFFLIVQPTHTMDPGDDFNLVVFNGWFEQDGPHFGGDGSGRVYGKRFDTATVTNHIVNNSILTNLYTPGVVIGPDSEVTSVIGIDVFDPLADESLTGMRIYFNPEADLNPGNLLAPLDGGEKAGVSVWKGSTHLPSKIGNWKDDFTYGYVYGIGEQNPLKAGVTLSWFDDERLDDERVCWFDRDQNGRWSDGDVLWIDSEDPFTQQIITYDYGTDTPIIAKASDDGVLGVALNEGFHGFAYYDENGDTHYELGEDLYFLGKGRKTLGYFTDIELVAHSELPTTEGGGDDFIVKIKSAVDPNSYGLHKFSFTLPNNAIQYTQFHSDANQDLTTSTVTLRVPPTEITNFVATRQEGKVRLNWSNPSGLDYYSVLIVRTASDTAPGAGEKPLELTPYKVGDSIGNGKVVYRGSDETFTDSDVSNSSKYFYQAFAGADKDMISATPFPVIPISDTTPPAPVSDLVIARNVGNVTITWGHPDFSDVSGIVILRRADGTTAPTLEDGTVYNQGNTVADATVLAILKASQNTLSKDYASGVKSIELTDASNFADPNGQYTAYLSLVGSGTTEVVGYTDIVGNVITLPLATENEHKSGDAVVASLTKFIDNNPPAGTPQYTLHPYDLAYNYATSVPHLELVAPVGNENWALGTTRKIEWKSYGDIGGTIRIDLYKSDSWFEQITASTDNSKLENSYEWELPTADSYKASDFKIKITSNNDATLYDMSSNDFELSAQSLALTADGAGEYGWGDKVKISWTSNLSGTVDVDLLLDDNLLTNLATGVDSSGASNDFEFLVDPTWLGTGYSVKITHSDSGKTDSGSSTFTVLPGSYLTLLGPLGGESFNVKEANKITWKTNIGGTSNVEYSDNGGTTWKVIDAEAKNNGELSELSWDTDVAVGKKYRIRVTSNTDSSRTDKSDNDFSIKPVITLTAPNGGETLDPAVAQKVTWDTKGIAGNVDIYLYKGGVQVKALQEGFDCTTDGSHEFAWTIAASTNSGTDYSVRVSSASDSSFYDASDADFAISRKYSVVVSKTTVDAECSQGTNPDPATFEVYSSGEDKSDFTVALESGTTASWLGISPSSGSSIGVADPETITLTFDSTGLDVGEYTAKIDVTDANADNSPQSVTVTLKVYGKDVTLTMAVTPDGGGGTNPNGAVTVKVGASTQILAIPSKNYAFTKWVAGTGSTVTDAAKALTTVVLTDDATVTAEFTKRTPGAGGAFAGDDQSLGSSDSKCVALGDLNGDSYPDAVVANASTDNLVWINDGLGTFTESNQVLGDQDTRGVALGDLDADGDLDAVFANHSVGNTVYTNDGSGKFSDSSQALGTASSLSVALGDIDLDGDLDAVFANAGANAIWINDGKGVFTQSAESIGTDSLFVALGDLDGDSDLDIVLANNAASISIYINDGKGVFALSGATFSSANTIALADVDGDSDQDIVGGFGKDVANALWLNNGDATFGDAVAISDLLNTNCVAFDDLNGDGKDDLVFANSSPNTIWFGAEAGALTKSEQELGDSTSNFIAIADLNLDGTSDLFVANGGTEGNKVWFNYESCVLTMKSDPEAAGTTDPTGATTVAKGKAYDIKATPATGYTFKQWTGTENATFTDSTLATTTVTLAGDAEVTATFVEPVDLTMSVDPSSAGTVTPNSSKVSPGVAIAISATAASGYKFSSWTVSANATVEDASAASTNVTLTAAATVTAVFVETVQLTTAVSPLNAGTVTPSTVTTVGAGDAVDISATATTGYAFISWSAAGDAAFANSDSATTKVTVNGNATVTANFIKTGGGGTATLTVNAVPVNAGTVLPEGQKQVPVGEAQTIIATVTDSRYAFIGWTVDGNASIEDSSAAETTVKLFGKAIVTARFSSSSVENLLVMKVSPEGAGTTDPEAKGASLLKSSSVVSISATASTGYSFSYWGVEGPATIDDAYKSATTLTLMGNATVTAYFVQESDTVSLTIAAGSGGAVAPEGVVTLQKSVPYEVKATSYESYVFSEWTISGDATIDNKYSSRAMVTLTGDAVLTATFKAKYDTATSGTIQIKLDNIREGRDSIKITNAPLDPQLNGATGLATVTVDGEVFSVDDLTIKGGAKVAGAKGSKLKLDTARGLWSFHIKNQDLDDIDNSDGVDIVLAIGDKSAAQNYKMEEKSTWSYNSTKNSSSTLATTGTAMSSFSVQKAKCKIDSFKDGKDKLTISKAGFTLSGTFDPNKDDVTVYLDDFSVLIPSGSFLEKTTGRYDYIDKISGIKIKLDFNKNTWYLNMNKFSGSELITPDDGVDVYFYVGGNEGAVNLEVDYKTNLWYIPKKINKKNN